MQGSSESRMRIFSCSWTKVTAANTAILATCRELGISFMSYSPPGRGFLTGKIRQLDDLAPDDWRRHGPRFQGENLEHNLAIVRHLEALALRKQCKPAQLALAWVLAQSDDVTPNPRNQAATLPRGERRGDEY